MRIAPNLLTGVLSLTGVALALTLAGMVFHVVHLVQDDRPKAHRLIGLWLVLLFFFGNVGQIIYYFARVHNHRPPDAAA